ncbi:MAG: ABC-2 type transport system permease protein [Candidatus Poriferisodalaceae bacterium]|jgi:ABC-2 type transport system permease protein
MTASAGAVQLGAIARRAIVGTVRQPASWIPSMVFPLFFTALSSAAFERTRNLPGFPEVSSFVAFLLAATIVQGVMFSATSAGDAVALDIETGFFDRLIASPVSRIAILGGRLAGTMVLGLVQALVFTGVLMLFGATMAAGVPGLLATMLMGALFAAAVGGFALMVGIRTGSAEAVQGFFPIFFALVFLSSAFFPPNLSGGWFEVVAGLNPISYMVDGVRELHVQGWDTGAALTALAVPALLAVVFMAGSLHALRRRLAA